MYTAIICLDIQEGRIGGVLNSIKAVVEDKHMVQIPAHTIEARSLKSLKPKMIAMVNEMIRTMKEVEKLK